MPYYIRYKGKRLGSPMSKQEAEEKLMILSRCFRQLEIVKERERVVPVRQTYAASAKT